MAASLPNVPNHPIYAELLKGHSGVIQETKGHVQRILEDLEEKRELCRAERILINTFNKDITESTTDCRNTIKETFQAMFAKLKLKQETMLRQLDDVTQYNLDVLGNRSAEVERTLNTIEMQMEEGQSLLQETDTFALFAKGALYKQLPPVRVQPVQLQFRDEFPDLTTISIAEYQVPLRHSVSVNMQEFLRSEEPSCICGNIFFNGFRFQIQLKHDERYLSVYLCLRAWHDVAPFLRVTIDFTISLFGDSQQPLHSATAKNTFEGPNDGWGWNKYIQLTKLSNCGNAMFHVKFNAMNYEFLAGERHRFINDIPHQKLQELSIGKFPQQQSSSSIRAADEHSNNAADEERR
jgi:hypothetical protein